MIDYRQSQTFQLVKSLYRDDYNNPLELTENELELFEAIAMKQHPRLHIMAFTRWGKSMTAGIAVLTRITTFPEKWAVVAGTKDKAGVIMGHIVQHIFDNEYTLSKFMPDKGESLEEIRRYRNKAHLTFKVGKDKEGRTLLGEVFIGSAKDALGKGAQNVIEDESALIDDNDHSFVVRMLGDDPNKNFLAKIGNPFQRNHFLKSFQDPAFKKITVDCYQGLKEGRISQAVIDENKPYSFFKILYECQFPSASEVDESGWMYLLTDEDIKTAIDRSLEIGGYWRLGLDVARGGRNYNAWVLRSDNFAKVLQKNQDNDLISVGDATINFMRDEGVDDTEVYIDDSGVGGGVSDYLKNRRAKVNPVNFGERASSTEYLNMRAESYAGKDGVSSWIKQYAKLQDHKDWYELAQIRYKKDAGGKIKIEPKEDMRKRGIESPDVADALALTFAPVKKSVYYGIDPAEILEGGVKPYYPSLNI
jgi:hypothetical protein